MQAEGRERFAVDDQDLAAAGTAVAAALEASVGYGERAFDFAHGATGTDSQEQM
jgi:hypothetical protein